MKPKWAEGPNYLTVAKRVSRASTHPTAVLLSWALSGLKTPIQTVAFMSISGILTVAIMSNSVVHEST